MARSHRPMCWCKVKASGLCHTDLEVIQGSLAYPLPIVLGHEGAGVVEAVGCDVTQVKAGDHVICSWNPHCGHCFYCERDLPILCEPFARNQPKGFLLDGRSRMKRDGDQVHHYSVTSTHAEYTRRAGVRRDRGAEGDSVRSRLHHRLRRDDRRGRGGTQGEGRRRAPVSL